MITHHVIRVLLISMSVTVVLLPSVTGARPPTPNRPAQPFDYTERRDWCDDYDVQKQPFFGILHQHTGRSFDAALRFIRTTPDEAYRFARKRGKVTTPDQFGFQTRQTVIPRALDFLGITDHSEYFGEVGLCTAPATSLAPGRQSLECALMTGFMGGPRTFPVPVFPRAIGTAAFTLFGTNTLSPASLNLQMPMCNANLRDCKDAELRVWDEMIKAARRHYDRTSACRFSTFVAYENTATPTLVNHHRNVIFRNEDVLERPFTAVDMARRSNPLPRFQVIPPTFVGSPNPVKLWKAIKNDCNDAPGRCEALIIPHNSNLASSVGLTETMMADPPGATRREQRRNARLMAEVQPLIEIYQDKGSSECRKDPRFLNPLRPWLEQTGLNPDDAPGPGGGPGQPGVPDEYCGFELIDGKGLASASGVAELDVVRLPPSEFDDRAYVRNILKDGFKLKKELGVNPFKLGIGASTDDHNGRAGFVSENKSFNGHLGTEDAIPSRSAGTFQNSPGGLWVAWAEENSRDSLFTAFKNKETYGTSGTRPKVRFFGGWGFNANVCEQNFVKKGYKRGVPMGGDLPARTNNKNPHFIAAAWKDDFIGTDLQRIQIVKGWIDSEGDTHEAVYEVVETENDGGSVSDTCEVEGKGSEHLCVMWEDEDFDPEVDAFYYARVLENPVCRYSTDWCQSRYGINPLLGHEACTEQLERFADTPLASNVAFCCSQPERTPTIEPIIQERAWTSPIWYSP